MVRNACGCRECYISNEKKWSFVRHSDTQGNLINKEKSMNNALLNIYIRDG